MFLFITESAEFDVLAQEHEKLQENKVHVQHICMYVYHMTITRSTLGHSSRNTRVSLYL